MCWLEPICASRECSLCHMQCNSWVNSPELLSLLLNERSLRLCTWMLWQHHIALKGSNECSPKSVLSSWQFSHKHFTDWHQSPKALWRPRYMWHSPPSSWGWISPLPHLSAILLPFHPALSSLISIKIHKISRDTFNKASSLLASCGIWLMGITSRKWKGRRRVRLGHLFLQLFLNGTLRIACVSVPLPKATAPGG